MVLLSHAPELTDGNTSREPLHRFTHTDFNLGSVGVDGFFLLSGFLIVQSWQRNPELGNYLRKRLLRIVPGYLVAALLGTLVIGLLAPGVDHFFSHLTIHYPESLLLLGGLATPIAFPGAPFHIVNGSLWTIPYEFRCYLLVPLLGLCGFLRRPAMWVVLTVAMLILQAFPGLMGAYPTHKFFLLTGEPAAATRLTATFLTGACFYLFRQRIVFRPLAAFVSAAVVVGALLLLPAYFETALVIFGGYLLFYLAWKPLPSLAWMKRFPDISYGVYLYGGPVESLWIWYHRDSSPWVTFAVSTVICFGLGWMSWHLVERPMLTFKRRASAPLPPP